MVDFMLEDARGVTGHRVQAFLKGQMIGIGHGDELMPGHVSAAVWN